MSRVEHFEQSLRPYPFRLLPGDDGILLASEEFRPAALALVEVMSAGVDPLTPEHRPAALLAATGVLELQGIVPPRSDILADAILQPYAARLIAHKLGYMTRVKQPGTKPTIGARSIRTDKDRAERAIWYVS